MTIPNPDRRRQNVEQAHLEGRMDLLDRNIAEVEEAVERLDKKLDEQSAILTDILKSIRSIELSNKDRESEHKLLAQRVAANERKLGAVADVWSKSGDGEKGNQGATAEQSKLLDWYYTIVVAFKIAAMGLILLAAGVFVVRNVVRTEAVEVAGKVVETVK